MYLRSLNVLVNRRRRLTPPGFAGPELLGVRLNLLVRRGSQTGIKQCLMCIISPFTTHLITMRTNIEIDDALMTDALAMTGLRTKKEAVELGLKTLIRLKKQERIKLFKGKLRWQGDLEEMRTDS